jgi:Transglycosylase SLT domain
MARFFLLALLLLAVPRTAVAEPAPAPHDMAPPGLIAGPGLIPRLAGAPFGTWGVQPGGAERPAPPTIAPAAGPGRACRQAIAAAEPAMGIPAGLLQAIGLVESGRPLPGEAAPLPWPWTVDADGNGAFYAGKEQAIAAVRAAQAVGIRSIDVGCLQVSLLHHPHAFASLEQAFDPVANARFAAGFLRRLFDQTHDWAAAAAAYHSQTPALAGPYRAHVLAAWARLGGPPADVTETAAVTPFPAMTAATILPPRPDTFHIIRTGPFGRPVPPGRTLATYRRRPIARAGGG